MTRARHPVRGNVRVAARLTEYADLLEAQQADGFRIAAYRRAAETVARLDRPLAELLAEGGRDALEALPGIGRSITGALAEIIATGRWSQLDRLRGETGPERLLETIPGIGAALAHRIADSLAVETLEELEIALEDGRLAQVAGVGPRRRAMVRQALAERLGALPRSARRHRAPPTGLLLEIDRAYRAQADAGTLRTIAPRRFNPDRRVWLPVLHLRRGPWDFTALFSNSARAHRLGRVGDWVIVHYDDGHGGEGQCTVVTERRGPRAGTRVVRGTGEQSALAAKGETHAPERAAAA